MFATIRKNLPVAAVVAALIAASLFAAADDPTTDIIITCPDLVVAPNPVFGNVTEYTPAVFVLANGKQGVSIPVSQTNPNLSGTTYFMIPTDVDRAPETIVITASDSAGQTGTAFVMVLRPM